MPILTQRGERDDDLNADLFTVSFDTYNQMIDAFTFLIYPPKGLIFQNKLRQILPLLQVQFFAQAVAGHLHAPL